jgi:hypothetical protein
MAILLPLADYREILNSDPDWTEHVVADGIYDSQFDVDDMPQINFSLWEPEHRQAQLERINRVAEYVLSPCIVDNFNDHEDRREWRHGLERKYPWFYDFYENNALRIGFVFLEMVPKPLMKGYIGMDSQHVVFAGHSLASVVGRYKQNSTPSYGNIAHIQYFAHNLLSILSSQTPNPVRL